MKYYGHAVSRESYVKLDAVRAVADCARKCSESVFRSDGRGSPMAED
jgi:hypothetical protein